MRTYFIKSTVDDGDVSQNKQNQDLVFLEFKNNKLSQKMEPD